MRHCTHIYCAMSTLHKTGLQRRCGLCEYAMTHSEITAEMIADNHHTPPWLAQMIYRCKGADKLCVVSDSIAPGGLYEKEGMFYWEQEKIAHRFLWRTAWLLWETAVAMQAVYKRLTI